MLRYSAVELLVLAIFLGLAAAKWGRGGVCVQLWRRATDWLIPRGGLPALVVGGIALTVALLLAWQKPPIPSVHDEFAYLLAADTFVHGRLANPPHPLWEHFETFHVLMQPTYASKYPPGQGLVLALGQLATGTPWMGLVLLTGLAAAATWWLLCGWVPRRWALFGAVLFAVNAGVQINWGMTYWGGLLPLLGASLLFGGLPRLVRTQRGRYAVLMSVGVSILALSRPYEGLVATLAATAILAANWQRRRLPWSVLVRRGIFPAMPALVATFGFLLYNNYCVTGTLWRMPYALHSAQYLDTPLVLWQTPTEQPREYRHEVFNKFFAKQRRDFLEQRTLSGYFTQKSQQTALIWRAMLGVACTLPLLWLPYALRRREQRAVLWAGLGVLASVLVLAWLHAHYLAPAVPLFLILLVQCCRTLRASRWFSGRLALAGVVSVYLLTTCLTYYRRSIPRRGWQDSRQELLTKSQGRPEKHLVIVRYGEDHNPDHDWVFNLADIDRSSVVFARELDAERNRKLLEYFDDRLVWLVLADENPPKLIRHRRQTPPTPGSQTELSDHQPAEQRLPTASDGKLLSAAP